MAAGSTANKGLAGSFSLTASRNTYVLIGTKPFELLGTKPIQDGTEPYVI
jgi:hypothetical protein